MTLEQFNEKVTQLKAEGAELAKAGKLEEAEAKKALQRRIEILCGVASLKLGEEVFRDITITFKRNVPADSVQTVQMINGLQGIVSNETLLGQVDFVTDVQKELERVKEQKEQNMSMYGFGNFDDSEDESQRENSDEKDFKS